MLAWIAYHRQCRSIYKCKWFFIICMRVCVCASRAHLIAWLHRNCSQCIKNKLISLFSASTNRVCLFPFFYCNLAHFLSAIKKKKIWFIFTNMWLLSFTGLIGGLNQFLTFQPHLIEQRLLSYTKLSKHAQNHTFKLRLQRENKKRIRSKSEWRIFA